jgi:hypothetical protein
MPAPITDRIHPLLPLAAVAATMAATVALAPDRVLVLVLGVAVILVLAALSALDRPRRTRRR